MRKKNIKCIKGVKNWTYIEKNRKLRERKSCKNCGREVLVEEMSLSFMGVREGKAIEYG